MALPTAQTTQATLLRARPIVNDSNIVQFWRLAFELHFPGDSDSPEFREKFRTKVNVSEFNMQPNEFTKRDFVEILGAEYLQKFRQLYRRKFEEQQTDDRVLNLDIDQDLKKGDSILTNEQKDIIREKLRGR